MKTEVDMKRELFGTQITQRSKSEFFSATDLVRAANKWRLSNGKSVFNFSSWLKTKQTQEFMQELEERFGTAIVMGRGRNHTWMHPLLFIDLALAISPKLKIEVYEWLFDHLIRYRNDSGDSYKLMCGALWKRHTRKQTFSVMIKGLALRIRKYCGVRDWQKATEDQLAKRNRIHEDIALLADVMNNNDEAVRLVFDRMNRQILVEVENIEASPKKQLSLLQC